MPNNTQITFNNVQRLLILEGNDGAVACKIHDKLTSSTIPSFSSHNRVESATRTLLRLNNLTAVRGSKGESMVGPLDYFGNLECPSIYNYVIEIINGIPVIYKSNSVLLSSTLVKLHAKYIKRIQCNWVSGKDSIQLNQLCKIYKNPFGESLFPNPGILEVFNLSKINLKYFDPINVDLSSFKVRLVENGNSFKITNDYVSQQNEYRSVSFFYETGYANRQIRSGGGLFLETHAFVQTMTPMNADSGGFIILGRETDKLGELDILGLQIPYGYTLIIEKGSIHGDATFNGMYMMNMTSDHTTMNTANCVFIKNAITTDNMTVNLIGCPSKNECNILDTDALVIYNSSTQNEQENFTNNVSNNSCIFNPFSKHYWKYLENVIHKKFL